MYVCENYIHRVKEGFFGNLRANYLLSIKNDPINEIIPLIDSSRLTSLAGAKISDMVLTRDTLSCLDDHLCQMIFKSHHA